MLSNSKPKWDVQSEVGWSCFIYPPPPCFCLSHSCVSYVHEAPGSVRHQKGNICNSSTPPGQAVLTGRWFVQCTQWGYAKNTDMGGQDRQTERGWRGKKCASTLPCPYTPTPHCFIWGSVYPEIRFTVSSAGLLGQTPLHRTSSTSPHIRAFKGLLPAALWGNTWNKY